MTVNWLLTDPTTAVTHKEQLALAVLNHLLVGTSSAVLHKALTESKLGETIMGGGLSDELIQATFSVGLKGVVADKDDTIETKLQKIETIIDNILRQIAADGFDHRAIQASMNIVEFHLREFNTGSYPKGLAMMLSVLPDWVYEDSRATSTAADQKHPSLVDALRFEEALAELKNDIVENGSQVFKELVRRHLVENNHRVVVHSEPDRGLEARVQTEEVERLAAIRASMSPEEVQTIIAETAALKHAQLAEDSAEAKATLPRLTLEDIDRRQRETPLAVQVPELLEAGRDTNIGGHTVILSHELQSNGILYADVAFDYSNVRHADIELLGLFGRMLLECGTDKLTELELHQHINTETGGVGASYMNTLKHATNKVSAPEDVALYLVLRGKATTEKIPILFDIFHDILANAKLDNQKRFVEMLKETKAAKESAVISSGHSYAATRLGSKFSYLGFMAERSSGITYISGLKALLEQATDDWPSVLTRLEGMRNVIHSRRTSNDPSNSGSSSLVINLTGSRDVLEESAASVTDFLSKVPTATATAANAVDDSDTLKVCPVSFDQFADSDGETDTGSLPSPNEGFVIPSQVNYVARGGQLVLPREDLSSAKVKAGSFSVIAKYLSTSYLWDHVRVLGGAYGASCSFGVDSGRFLFTSYRDPNIVDTLTAYNNAGEFIQSQLTAKAPAVAPPAESAEVSIDGSADAESSSTTSVGVSDDVLLQFIIGSIGDLDSPQSPDQEGYSSMNEFIKGEPAEDRQRYRDEILSTNREDFALFAERLGNMFAKSDRCSTVVFGSESALQQANGHYNENEKALLELKHAVPPIATINSASTSTSTSSKTTE